MPLPITALAFDSGGERIAASGYHEITVWNSHSRELIQRVGNIAERTFDVAFSSDGRWLACASGTPGKVGEVKLFNATNGELARVLEILFDEVQTFQAHKLSDRKTGGKALKVILYGSYSPRRLGRGSRQRLPVRL